MKNNLVKRLAIFAVAAVMTFSVAACGNKAEETTAPETETTEDAAPAEEPVVEAPVEEPAAEEPVEEAAPASATALTEEEYLTKVTELGVTMTEAQTKISAVDENDVEAATALIEELKVPFTEFAALEAPEAYAEAQAKFKSGCEAMIEYLDVCLEMMAAAVEDENADLAEFETKITTLYTTIQADFTEGATLIMPTTDAAATDAAATDAAATDAAATDAEATDAAATDAAAEKTDKAN